MQIKIIADWAMWMVALLAFAQQAPEETSRRTDSPRDRVNRQFDARAPRVGDTLPDVAGLDEEGREFRLSRLKGQYTVLVFGCLT